MIANRVATVARVSPSEFDSLNPFWSDPSLGITGFFSGRTPSPDELREVLLGRLMEHLVVKSRRSDETLGYVAVINPSLRNGTAELALTFGRRGASPVGLVGVALAVTELFRSWPFRKLTARSAESTYTRLASGEGVFFETECRIPEYIHVDGRFDDEYRLAIWRDAWYDEVLDHLVKRYGPIEPA